MFHVCRLRVLCVCVDPRCVLCDPACFVCVPFSVFTCVFCKCFVYLHTLYVVACRLLNFVFC